MKKIITNKINTVIMLFVFVCLQGTAWAMDTTNTESTSRTQEFFSMPSVWIAIVGIIACVGLAIFTGNKTDEHIEA